MPSTLLPKFQQAKAQMKAGLIERDDEVDNIWRGVVAKEHVLLIGAPGTAKSLACRLASLCFSDAEYFAYLMTKYTVPEEIYGPIDLPKLKEGRFCRMTERRLPTAHFVTLDEVFKSSSAIINTALGCMEERVYDNGAGPEPIPLRMLMGTSNEWPVGEGMEALQAVFDRFLIRTSVKPVSPARRQRLLHDALPEPKSCLSMQDVDQAVTEASLIPFTQESHAALDRVIDALSAEGIRPGDRRLRKSIKVARAEAWLEGADEVCPEHLECLKDVLWVDPLEQANKARDVICKIANPVGAEIMAILMEAEEVLAKVDTTQANAATFSGVSKANDSLRRLETICSASGAKKDAKGLWSGGNTKAVAAANELEARVLEIQNQLLRRGRPS